MLNRPSTRVFTQLIIDTLSRISLLRHDVQTFCINENKIATTEKKAANINLLSFHFSFVLQTNDLAFIIEPLLLSSVLEF